MRTLVFCLVSVLVSGALAQAPDGSSTARAQAPLQRAADAHPEPQVNADGTVTFRLVNPNASKVGVAIEGVRAPFAMTRDDGGVWSFTSPTLAPEFYSYHFVADGRTELDARNPSVKASYTAVGNAFLVPGSPAMPWEQMAVAHGVVHHHTYTTRVALGLDGNQSEYYVYTPPGYNPRAAVKYPVLYLLHGYSDTAAGWSVIGHANDILDNLIASGKARPMIVVMPLGYGDMAFLRQGFGVWSHLDVIDHNTSLFSATLLTEILPQVEALYNVSARREDRAIAGLSMGGLEALTIGLNHTDEFAAVGGFSAAVHMLDPAVELTGFNAKTAKLQVLWIACGTSDDLIGPNRRLVAALKAQGATVTAVETPGIHTWLVWRDNLVNFVPLLFRGK